MSTLSPSEMEPHRRERIAARTRSLRGWCLWLSQGLWTDATAWSPLLPLLMARPERPSWAYSFREVYVPRWLLGVLQPLQVHEAHIEADRREVLVRLNAVAMRHGRWGVEALASLARLDVSADVMRAAFQSLEGP